MTLPHHRRGRRCRVSLKAKYRATGARDHEGIVYNLGEEGIFLCTSRVWNSGAALEISIWLPGVAEPVEAEGQVVWTNAVESASLPAGMGIHFTHLEEEARLLLWQLLERLV